MAEFNLIPCSVCLETSFSVPRRGVVRNLLRVRLGPGRGGSPTNHPEGRAADRAGRGLHRALGWRADPTGSLARVLHFLGKKYMPRRRGCAFPFAGGRARDPPHRSFTRVFLTWIQETMENVKKCKNFLSTLIKLASSGKQSTETAANVKELVQSLLVRARPRAPA